MPSFDDIRSRFPGAKDLTDEEIIERTAEITKLPLSVVAEDFGYTPRTRNPAAFANDTVIGIANSALGGVQAVGDFFSPGNRFSNAIGEVVKEGEAKQSLPVRIENEKLNQALSSDEFGTQVSGVKDYVLRNPIQAAGQAIGSFAIPFGSIKLAKGGAQALGLTEKAVGRVATGSAVGTSGVLAGGDAAGDAYDQIYNNPKFADMSPEERHELATKAARQAQVVPTLIGGFSGMFGADKALATGTRSILKTAGSEFLSEATEEGVTKLSANLAAREYDPDIKAMTGVYGSAALGGVLGGGTGLAIGAATKQRPAGSFLDGANETQGSSDSAIRSAIDNTNQSVPVGPPPQSAMYGPNLPEVAGPQIPLAQQQALLQAQQQVEQQQQLEAQAKEAQARLDAVRQEVFTKYGGVETTIPNGTKPMWVYQGKNYFTEDSLGKALDVQIKKEMEKSPLVREVETALTKTYEAVGIKPYSPGRMASFLAPFTDQAESLEEVANRIEAQLGTIKRDTPESDTLTALRNVILGKDINEPFGDANPAPADNAAVPAASTPAVTQTKPAKKPDVTPAAQAPGQVVDVTQQYLAEQAANQQGGSNGQLQVQNPAGIRAISEQGGTSQNSGGVVVRPDEIRPERTGSNALLTDTQQDVGLRVDGTRTVATTSGEPNANVRDDRQEALSQVRRIFTELFGSERDAQIIMELQDDSNPQTQTEIAKKYGVNQSTVSRILKVLQSDTLGPRFFLAAKKLGYSKDEVASLIVAIEGTQEQDTDTEIVDDRTELLDRQADDALPNTNADDVNPAFSDDAKLGNEEVFGDEDSGATRGGYQIVDSIAGTKSADASSSNKTAAKYKKEKTNWKKYDDFELQNLIADEIVSDADLLSLVEEIKRREDKRIGASNANEKSGSKSVPVGKQSKGSKRVRKQDTQKQEAPAEDLNLTTEEQAANAWDKVASKIANAPLFEELSEEQQQTFIAFGSDNWTAADVNNELNKIASDPNFSKRGKKPADAWSASDLTKDLKETFNSNETFNDLVTIVDSVYDLDADLQTEVLKSAKVDDVQGFAKGGRVYLIANNITKGAELSVMLHELGAHVGMKNLVGEYNYKKLIAQIERWAEGKGTPIEVKIAKAAQKRVADANVAANQKQDELLAYFVEEAVLAGINPTATEIKGAGQIIQMLRTMLAAMKVALRKIGFAKFDSLTAANVVDLAFGAAKMELDGTYHGTEAKFRVFKDTMISNVLNGWGFYTTNDRKESETYGKKTIRALPIVDRKDLIQGDKQVGDQPALVKKLRAVADKDFQAFLDEIGFERLDGGDFQEALGNWEVTSEGGLFKLLSKDAQDRVVDVKEIVSTFLDEQGIPGSTFKPYGRGMPNRQTVIFRGDRLDRVSQETEKGLQFSLAAARKETQARIDRMPKAYRGTVQKMFDFLTTKNLSDRTVAFFAFTRDVTARAAKAGLKSAQDYQRLDDARKAILGAYSSRMDKIVKDIETLPKVLKGTGPQSINRFLKDSTVQGKWGFQPDWLPKPIVVDPVMEERFKEIEKQSPTAAAAIKAMLHYNYDTNQDMKKWIMDSIRSVYDVLIEQARKDGDVIEEARATKEKAKELSQYATRLAIRNEKPYAALKRYGDIVLVAKSQAYLDAEKADDNKTIREIQEDENHYVVRYFESNSEAQAAYREMQKAGYAYLSEPFDGADPPSGVFRGSDMNGVFHRLRTLVESQDSDDPVARGMNRILNSLHLKLLSEESVRQSENQRKNITGSDDDMVRAFVTQGRAAAHFISSLTNSAGINDALRDMRKERDAYTPGKNIRAIYFNEIMKRHGMSLEYTPTPVIDAALNVTSTWMLLTSPGYFFQNMTQPFMMSLPYMAADPKYGYNRTTSELLKAYGEIKDVIGVGKRGLSEGDYKDLPEDVRAAIEALVNRGSINISLSSDLGRVRSAVGANEDMVDKGLDAYAKGTDMLRGFAENLESINRLTTAMTAYRLAIKSGKSEEAAINYADEVIYNTHGDYAASNAPRFMRTGAGRVATQFRKFQLIQLSLLARMWHHWRQSATPQERMVAKRQLMFTVGHTLAIAGIKGAPGFTALAYLFGALFGDDDEPDNPELALRKAIGDSDLADLLVSGVPAFMGVDLSGKLGMSNMLSILPYTDFKLTRDSLNQAAVALIGGPFLGGVAPRALDGAAYMAAGDYYKGLEALMPKGLSDAMKGLRYGTEGVTNKRGDIMLSPDEISFMDAFLSGLGLPTKTITDRQFLESAKFQFDEFYNSKTTELKNAYAKAYRSGDSQQMSKIRDKWQEIQESRIKNGYSRQPLSTLIKAPQEQRKREQMSAAGVGYNKSNRGFVQQNSER